MEVKIGETVNFNEKILQACESTELNGCKGCFFEEYHPLCLDYTCAAKEREDGKDVIFKETINNTMKIRDEIKDFQSIVQAWVEGKIIQYKFDEGWRDASIENMLGDISKYRVKPESKYRPFKTQEECWQEMHKHSDFGWVIAKDSKIMYHICVVGIGYVLIDSMSPIFSEAFAEYEFTDGTPFGIKEE